MKKIALILVMMAMACAAEEVRVSVMFCHYSAVIICQVAGGNIRNTLDTMTVMVGLWGRQYYPITPRIALWAPAAFY